MQKFFLSLLTSTALICFGSAYSIAQPTLGANISLPLGQHIPVVGVAESSVPNQGAAGANITWDFSGMVSDQSQTVNFVATGQTPFAANFGSATVAAEYESGLSVGSTAAVRYEFFSLNAANLIRHGLATNQNVVVSYSNPQTALTLPFSYQSTNTDDFAADFSVSGLYVSETGTISVTGDGYGTLILPNATISNVLRVRVVQDYTDLVDNGSSFSYHVETYVWYHPNIAYPLLVISDEHVQDSPLPSIKTVYYAMLELQTGIADVYPTFTLKAYPNPTADRVFVDFYLPEAAEVGLSVYDIMGRKVQEKPIEQLSPGKGGFQLNFGGYPRGIYLAEMVVNGHQQTYKIAVR